MLEIIKSLDTQLFLFLNGKHNAFFDVIMYWASDKFFWIPFYALIFLFIVKHFRRQSIWIFICIALLIIVSDQISSHLIKNCVQRLRPSHEPALQGLIHLSKAGAGGTYGFVSSHAANAFALTTFLFFILQDKFKWLKVILIPWALLVSYSRIYNGVHYPLDVLVAMLLGIILGWLLSNLYFRFHSYQIIKI